MAMPTMYETYWRDLQIYLEAGEPRVVENFLNALSLVGVELDPNWKLLNEEEKARVALFIFDQMKRIADETLVH